MGAGEILVMRLRDLVLSALRVSASMIVERSAMSSGSGDRRPV